MDDQLTGVIEACPEYHNQFYECNNAVIIIITVLGVTVVVITVM
jgi:hypothetical protein